MIVAFAMSVVKAWMGCSEFAARKADENQPYPTLVERWTQKSVAYENQSLLVMEMIDADVKRAISNAKAKAKAA